MDCHHTRDRPAGAAWEHGRPTIGWPTGGEPVTSSFTSPATDFAGRAGPHWPSLNIEVAPSASSNEVRVTTGSESAPTMRGHQPLVVNSSNLVSKHTPAIAGKKAHSTPCQGSRCHLVGATPVAAGDARGNCDETQGERPQRRVRDTDDSGPEGAADECQAPTARTEASADQAAVDVVPTHQADGLHTATVGEAKARRQYLSTRWVRPSM